MLEVIQDFAVVFGGGGCKGTKLLRIGPESRISTQDVRRAMLRGNEKNHLFQRGVIVLQVLKARDSQDGSSVNAFCNGLVKTFSRSQGGE
jgi:hypothetical protein